jgi:putative peptidoglycan lipid II flippase
VRAILRRAVHAVVQAALLALQLLTLMLLTSRVPGGTVALQVALNFYALPIAIVATPIGLALLPTLSRLVHKGDVALFREAYVQGVSMALFLAVPASIGYVLLAEPIAHVAASGQMATVTGQSLIAGALGAVALGMVGQTAFFVTTQASYARGDTRTPLACMVVQALACLVLCTAAVAATTGPSLVRWLAAAYAVASLLGGATLMVRMLRGTGVGIGRVLRSVARVLVGVAAMAPAVHWVAVTSQASVDGRAGWALGLLLGSLVGLGVFLSVQMLLRSPELGWLRSGFTRRASFADVGTQP